MHGADYKAGAGFDYERKYPCSERNDRLTVHCLIKIYKQDLNVYVEIFFLNFDL